jgi:hypothetical protein
MALKEKKGALIYYKHLKILEEAHLTDEEIGKIFGAAIRYDETGVLPQFKSPLSALFMMIRYDLDANMEKYNYIKDERSKAGKKGGRPRKKPKEPIGYFGSAETNSFLDGQEDPEETGESLPPLPEIKAAARNAGFFIDSSIAQHFRDCGLDPDWLRGPNSFLDLATDRILENYGEKPLGEQRALFISAVRTWEDLRDEYPEWKARKDVKDRAAEQEAAEKAARENHPTHCVCGNELRLFRGAYCCESCGTSYTFNRETLEWDAEQRKPEAGLMKLFLDRTGKK